MSLIQWIPLITAETVPANEGFVDPACKGSSNVPLEIALIPVLKQTTGMSLEVEAPEASLQVWLNSVCDDIPSVMLPDSISTSLPTQPPNGKLPSPLKHQSPISNTFTTKGKTYTETSTLKTPTHIEKSPHLPLVCHNMWDLFFFLSN